ncbi:MAG: hypothetical protein ACO3PR_00075 [Limisphaerales bacterium]
MAKSSFAELNEDADESNGATASAEATSTATEGTSTEGGLVTQEASGGELALNNQMEDAGLSGDFQQSDVNLPRINIVAKTSQLVDDGFTPGAIVLNKEVELVKKDEPLKVIVLNMLKQFQEDVAWGEDRAPRVFNSHTELEAAGFSTEWGSPNLCRPMAHITMMIEAPDGLSNEGAELFPYEFNEKLYAMAVLTASKSAYKTTAKEIATFAAFAQGAGVWTTAWNLTSKLRTEGDVSWFSPALKRAGRINDDLLAFVEGVK